MLLRFALPFCLLAALPASADTLTVAVASNFAAPARAIAERFEAATGQPVRLVTGSTGKLYAQIVAGAPFDVFLSADEEAPARLLRANRATDTARYALGILVVVSADPALKDTPCWDALKAATGDRVAIANPATAPYGQAAERVLGRLDDKQATRQLTIVRGDNVAQAMHFVASGNARFGLVGGGQFHAVRQNWPGCATPLEGRGWPSIPQAAALLRRDASAAAAEAFFEYLLSRDARRIIAGWNYALPPEAAHDP